MYSWIFVTSMIAIIYIAIVTSYPRQYELRIRPQEIFQAKNNIIRIFTKVIFILVIFANVAFTFFEGGLHECPDNPTTYLINNYTIDFFKVYKTN